MSVIHTGVKRLVESALVATGGAAAARRRRTSSVLVLAYHNVVPARLGSVGDVSLHLAQRTFAKQLDSLLESHDLVGLDAALHQVAPEQRTRRPRATITFDDAYAGAMTAGVAELRARGLPATIFVTPSLLDGGSFWWDTFADPAAGLDSAFRQRALTEGRGLNEEVATVARSASLATHEMPAFARGASMNDLFTALDYPGITLAAHTWSHPNLSALPDSMLAAELARPFEWLGQFGDRALPMVSYPYGLADQRVRDAARAAGYTAGFMIDGGWSSAPPRDPFAIPRLNVPAGVSENGFVLRAAGLIQG